MSNIGGVVFGGVCLFLILAGIVYIGAVSSQQTPYTDTYGNSLSPVSSSSQALVQNETATGTGSSIWLFLIIGAILVCLIIVAIYLAAKTLNL